MFWFFITSNFKFFILHHTKIILKWSHAQTLSMIDSHPHLSSTMIPMHYSYVVLVINLAKVGITIFVFVAWNVLILTSLYILYHPMSILHSFFPNWFLTQPTSQQWYIMLFLKFSCLECVSRYAGLLLHKTVNMPPTVTCIIHYNMSNITNHPTIHSFNHQTKQNKIDTTSNNYSSATFTLAITGSATLMVIAMHGNEDSSTMTEWWCGDSDNHSITLCH